VNLFDIEQNKNILRIDKENHGHDGWVNDVKFLYDSNSSSNEIMWASASNDGVIKTFKTSLNKQENDETELELNFSEIEVHEKEVTKLAVSKCGKFMVSCGKDEKLVLFLIENTSEISKIAECYVGDKVADVRISEEKPNVVIAAVGNKVKIIKFENGQGEVVAEGSNEERGRKGKVAVVNTVCFSENEKEIYAGYSNGKVEVFEC